MAMKCAYHPEADAVGACVHCGKLICTECKVELRGKIHCNACAEEILLRKPEKEITSPRASTIVEENSSGHGGFAEVPQAVRGWNWGAFLLGWIWGIGNKVWLSLLTLIPYAGVIMSIVLGVKGSEWAWRSKRWESIEHFKRTQRTWAYWGAGVTVMVVMIIIIASVAS